MQSDESTDVDSRLGINQQGIRFASAFSRHRGMLRQTCQVTDAVQLARGSVWAATKAPGGESYNVTNGDLFRWNQLWPAIADFFEMPLTEPQTLNLRRSMADKGSLWESIAQKYDLERVPYKKLAAWGFGDLIFRCDWDVISSTTKIRQAGFPDEVDSTNMFMRLFGEFCERNPIP